MGVSINDLFGGAIISAYSKLDLAEDKRPSQFNTCVHIFIGPEDHYQLFRPKSNFGVWRVIQEPNTDLKQACLAYKKQMRLLIEKPYLVSMAAAMGNLVSFYTNSK